MASPDISSTPGPYWSSSDIRGCLNTKKRGSNLSCGCDTTISKDCHHYQLGYNILVTPVTESTVVTPLWLRRRKCMSPQRRQDHTNYHYHNSKHHWLVWVLTCCYFVLTSRGTCGYASEFDKSGQLLAKLNLEESIAAVFNKVAYGSTTKRSIPDNAYPVTTLATPLLTTFRYSDGTDEWLRVDVKDNSRGRSSMVIGGTDVERGSNAYGLDLEKDHVLPTSAPAADILKNNNNKHYNNPNRYNNDQLRPDDIYDGYDSGEEQVTEHAYKTTTTYNLLRNVRPTKSMYSKDIPSYVPPSRAFFTPPLPPEYQNPFADKPTLRGTNSEGFASRRPLPPPSLMPNKDRIPYRPDLPNKVNSEKSLAPNLGSLPSDTNIKFNPPSQYDSSNNNNNNNNKKKTLNTPSQNVRVGEFYGLNRSLNETGFEYEKSYAPEPSITRILSGSNGRQDDIPDILFRAVTATPRGAEKTPPPSASKPTRSKPSELPFIRKELIEPKWNPDEERSPDGATSVSSSASSPSSSSDRDSTTGFAPDVSEAKRPVLVPVPPPPDDVTTQIADMVNLPNVKERDTNVTKASSDEIWLICWNVHVYLVVIAYVLLAAYSIYKLVRYENDPHMFSKSYFLTIHLMLTVVCVLRIFYLIYDPYNANRSFGVFLYDFLHSFPLSLLATTFAVLILFLLKRTLTHLEVKTRPVFLVVFAVLHIVLCMIMSIIESLGHFERASLVVCRPIFVLLALALGFSYLYLYRIIKNVLGKKSQNLSEVCTQNISYASHITIAVALLFIVLGLIQLYALFSIKIDRFNGEIKHHWVLWGFELSVRFLEITIITLLGIVVSLKMSQREKQTPGGFPLFPCTTSDSSTDNIYPNNCNTNPNVTLNYSTRSEMAADNIPPTENIERPNLLLKGGNGNVYDSDTVGNSNNIDRSSLSSNFDRFERPNWSNSGSGSGSGAFERGSGRGSGGSNSATMNSARKISYDTAKYYTKPKYELEYNNEDYQPDFVVGGISMHPQNDRDASMHDRNNIYSEPVDNSHHQYERTRHEFERSDFDRRSRNSSNTSGRRSTVRSRSKNHARPHLGVQTLPNHEGASRGFPDSMLVDELGFVRFGQMRESDCAKDALGQTGSIGKPKRARKLLNNDMSHFSDA